MKSTQITTKVKVNNHTLKLLKGETEAEIFLDEEKIWTDHIENHVNSEDIKKSFDEYAIHCLSELSDIKNIETFGKFIDSNDTFQILSSMGYSLTFKFCSEGDLNEGQFMGA